jgi:glycosyltransferase involved in cell wall biosynthesis
MNPTILELVQSMEKGGRTKRIADTAIGLAKLGWDVKVLSMAPVPRWVEDRYHAQLKCLVLSKPSKLDLRYVFRLAALVKQSGITLIHAHCETSYLYGGLVGRLLGIPVVGTYHRSQLKFFEPSFKLRLFARLLTQAVAISNDRRELMIRGLKMSAEKITLIHGGANLVDFKILSDEAISELRCQLAVEDRRVLLSVGHLGPIKGHDVTLQALAPLVKQVPEVLLIIAGDGAPEDYQRLQALIESLQLTQYVRLLGQVHNVTEWLNVCELFVQPSIEEGFGLVFVEAGACKKAVVATAVGGIKDIVVNQETGLLVPPSDVDGLYQALYRLLTETALAKQYAEAASARVFEHFDLRHMITKYDELFSRLLFKCST